MQLYIWTIGGALAVADLFIGWQAYTLSRYTKSTIRRRSYRKLAVTCAVVAVVLVIVCAVVSIYHHSSFGPDPVQQVQHGLRDRPATCSRAGCDR